MLKLFVFLIFQFYIHLYFKGKSEKKEYEFIKGLKLNNLMLKEDKELTKYMKDKVTIKNVSTFYSVAKIHNLFGVAELSIRFIERCFPMIVETENFLQLDFTCFMKVISSSELDIHSEVEVFNAVNTWLKHNCEERSKYAIQLFLKVRLTLLSEHALKYIKNCNSSLNGIKEFETIINEVLSGKNSILQNNPSNSLTRRCCTQNKFKLLICGGYNYETNKVVRNTKQFDGNNFNNIKVLSSMNYCRESFKAVSLKGEVYVFGGSNDATYLVKIVEKYSPSTNTWKKVAKMFDDRKCFCACAFMNKIFLFGGQLCDENPFSYEITNSCLQFDIKQKNWSDKSWKKVSGMNEAREFAGCAVFQGRIVVSGGGNHGLLNTVESYDVFADKWSPMPCMVNCKNHHKLVVANNKLFVIGYGTHNCEVFDDDCKKFVAIKNPRSIFPRGAMSTANVIAIVHNVYIFGKKIICYDVDKDEWCEQPCEVTAHLVKFAAVKLPWY